MHALITRHLAVRARNPSNKETTLREPGSKEARDTQKPSEGASETPRGRRAEPGLRKAPAPTGARNSSPRRAPFKSKGEDSAGVRKPRSHPRPPTMAGNADLRHAEGSSSGHTGLRRRGLQEPDTRLVVTAFPRGHRCLNKQHQFMLLI